MSSMNFASARMDHQTTFGLDPARRDAAVEIAAAMRAKGQRVWCVPFARNASGIELRGNARTWWGQAEGSYLRRHSPAPGAVMVFKGTKSMPMGHVAVVSKIVDSRKVLVDHANWKRNQVSLGMEVIDVSAKNDWSEVRVRSSSAAYGRNYPVYGFIQNTNRG
ncbi:CHAP domain-containing protein [Thioclava sp. GXIMD4215]